MKIALIGLPGSGKTSLFNALTEHPVELVPVGPGAPPHLSVVKVHDDRLDWLEDHFKPKKCTPATLTIEDFAGIPPGYARKDRRGELFGLMRLTDGLAIVLRAFTTDRHVYDDPEPDPARDLELVGLECVTSDLDICERRLKRLQDEWRRLETRARVEREQAVVERIAAAVREGKGAFTVPLHREEEGFVKGFQLLTRKPAILLVNTCEEGGSPDLSSGLLDVRHRFEACASLEADLAAMDADDRDVFAREYGISEPLAARFILECYRGLGLRSFFTVVHDELRSWTIHAGDTAVTAAGKIHSDMEHGFIRAEVTHFEDLRELGGMKEARAKGKHRLESKEYEVMDGDILEIRFSK
jgi:GTP-binding protein YchF